MFWGVVVFKIKAFFSKQLLKQLLELFSLVHFSNTFINYAGFFRIVFIQTQNSVRYTVFLHTEKYTVLGFKPAETFD